MNCRPETAPQLESKTYDVNAVFDEENPTLLAEEEAAYMGE